MKHKNTILSSGRLLGPNDGYVMNQKIYNLNDNLAGEPGTGCRRMIRAPLVRMQRSKIK